MPEYIERNKAISEARYEFGNIGAKVMARIPAADVAPVVHGRWKVKKSPWAEGGKLYIFSECGKDIAIIGDKLNYCPSCGALMDLEVPQP